MSDGARGASTPGSFGEVREGWPRPSGSATPAGDGDRPSRGIIFLITVTGIMANTLLAPAVPDLVADLDISAGQAGLVLAFGTLPGIVVAPMIGLLADRHGRREVLVPCLVLFGLFGGLAGLAPSYATLLGCRLVQGIGSAGLINLAVVIIGDHWQGVSRSRVIGQNSAVLTSSLAVLPPLGGLLTDLGGWRLTFLPYWVALLTASAAWRALPASPSRAVRTGDQVREAVGFLRSGRVVGAISVGLVAFVLIFGLFLTALPLRLADEFGLGGGARGLVLGVPALTSTVAALSLGRLTARFGSRRLVLAATAGFALAALVVGLAPALPLLLLGAVLFGLSEGVTIPSLQDVVAGAAPASSRGAVFAVWVGGVRTGQTAGPVAAGGAVAAWGMDVTFVAGATLAVGLLAAQLVTGQPRDAEHRVHD